LKTRGEWFSVYPGREKSGVELNQLKEGRRTSFPSKLFRGAAFRHAHLHVITGFCKSSRASAIRH
jgi:hypothetical protein